MLNLLNESSLKIEKYKVDYSFQKGVDLFFVVFIPANSCNKPPGIPFR